MLNDPTKTPQIASSVFLAAGCKIIGDVTIGEQSSVWYNSVIGGKAKQAKMIIEDPR